MSTPTSRPVLFSGPMVRALLDGRKTQTRRIIKQQPTGEQRPLSEWSSNLASACHDPAPDPEKLRSHSDRLKGRIFPFADERGGLYSPSCPYGHPGDHLWVRETFVPAIAVRAFYRATDEKLLSDDGWTGRWVSSIHMPRALSRITLSITDVRAERLRQISEADAIAEGIEPVIDPRGNAWKSYEIIHQGPHKGEPHPHSAAPNRSPIVSYRELWESLNGAGSWEANPWVWVVSFERIQTTENAHD